MNELRESVAAFLQKHCADGDRIAVGVSGGRDSMCLIHAVASCGVVPRENIVAVHVNHGLRAEADDDQEFVRKFCEDNDICFSAHSVDVKRAAECGDLTVEQAARALRYGVFNSLLASGYSAVLTAHHALDNAESVLMHMFRGAGLDGLCGMSEADERKILRPLLTVYPDELDEYARVNGINYVVDKTNLSDDADRNFLRLNVIPLIEKRYRGAVRAVNALSRECASACELLDAALDRSLIRRDGGAVIISKRTLDGELRNRYIRAAIGFFSLVDVTRAQIERVARLKDMRVGSIVELSDGVVAAREYDGIALYVPRYKFDGSIPLEIGANFLDGLKISVAPVQADTSTAKPDRGETVDWHKLSGAELRFRRDGDVFTPYGGSQKKLKEYLINEKIPSRLRDRLPLVCKGSEVLVIVGHEISDKVKITDETACAARITLRS